MLENPRGGRTRGRQQEAVRNDERILAAALEVLIEDPRAPIAEIAARAGVGVASLYRRFAGRDELARRLAEYAMSQVGAAARDALARVDADPWRAFVGFLTTAIDRGAGSMGGFIGTFTAGEELNHAATQLIDHIDALLDRAQSADAVRADLTALDVLQLFEMLRAIQVGDQQRRAGLRRRYIAMLSPALRPQPHDQIAEPAPTWGEIMAVWNP